MQKVLGILIMILGATMLIWSLSAFVGLIFGYANSSELCKHYKANALTNGEYYFFTFTEYACQKDGGLLQPWLRNAIYWFDEPYKG